LGEWNDVMTRKLEERDAAHKVDCEKKDAAHLSALKSGRRLNATLLAATLAGLKQASTAGGARGHATAGGWTPLSELFRV